MTPNPYRYEKSAIEDFFLVYRRSDDKFLGYVQKVSRHPLPPRWIPFKEYEDPHLINREEVETRRIAAGILERS